MTKKTVIIAEAGVNHNGDLNAAVQLVKVAADSGADYVKFQTFKTENLVSKSAKMADYQKLNSQISVDTQFEMLKKLEMPKDWHFRLVEEATRYGIKFLSTGFDTESIDFLFDIGIDLFKIPSGEITNLPYLIHIAKKRKPVILSTGMADLFEIEEAVSILCENGIEKSQISVLHCNTDYPTKMIDVNLYAMNHIKQKLNVDVGYSDHTLGIEVPIAAVALGATIIEKHFTLDKDQDGPDHKASLNPFELKTMVSSIRNIELAISGSGIKEPTESELKNRLVARKSIHIAKPLQPGDEIKPDNLIMKRPGDGISPLQINKILGKKANSYLPIDHKLKFTDIGS